MSLFPHSRKANLRLNALHASGYISVVNSDTLNVLYNTIADIFDEDNTINSMIVLNNDGDPSWTKITISSNYPEYANLIELNIGVALSGRVVINGGEPDQVTVNWDTGRTGYNTNPKKMLIPFTTVQEVKFIRIYYDEFDAVVGSRDARLYGIQLYNTPTASDLIEFNDSVLSTKAWNSSRYDGRQLSALNINEFNSGDISYGNTPIIRNTIRTFYLATDVIGLGEPTFAERDDPTLHYIPGFSYLVVNKAITINEDDTITQVDINNFPNTVEGNNKFGGFKREFETNFPIGSNLSLISLDESVKNKTNKSYPIYFNRGLITPFLRVRNTTGSFSPTQINIPDFDIAGSGTYAGPVGFGSQYHIINKTIFSQVFSGSLYNDNPLSAGGLGQILQTSVVNTSIHGYDLYLTMLNTSGSGNYTEADFNTNTPLEIIRTTTEDNGVYPTENLAELSTVPILTYPEPTVVSGVSVGNIYYRPNNNSAYLGGLNQTYQAGIGPTNFSGSYDVSVLNEEKPSLLIPLNKGAELPEGRGQKPIVVLPEDLHPYVKDNIIHFSAKAGLDLGDRKIVPKLDTTNQNLS